ncbi:FecR family protein [Spirosoma koreense]
MNQYDFDKLVEKYLAGQSSPGEEKLLHEWSEKKLEQSASPLDQVEQRVIGEQIWNRLYRHTLRRQPFLIRWGGWVATGAVAASVVLLLMAGSLYWKWPVRPSTGAAVVAQGEAVEQPHTISIKNTTDKAQRISLKDGSAVVLKPRSSLSYPERFGDKTRQIYLQGEAFFDVRRDPARPFMVHTGALITQVLGTSFTIRSYDEDKAIEVLVTRGRVSVYESSEKSVSSRNGVILIPNQKITFDKASQKLTPGLVEVPQLVQPPETRTSFVFDKTPLTQVFAALNKAYGVEILIENQALNRCIFNGDLNDLPLFVQLDLICKSVNATYERRGTTLFIHGEGCLD